MKKLFLLCLLPLVLSGCWHNSNNIFQGYVEGNYTYVSSPVSGQLDKLFVSRGTQVNKGQPLYILDQQPEAAKLKQAQNNLAAAEQTLVDLTKGQRADVIKSYLAQREQAVAQLNLDRKTLHRYRKLFDQGAIDKASVDTALATYQRDQKKVQEIDANIAEAKLGARINQVKAQEATVSAAKAAVKQAKWALDQKTVFAGIAGQVFDTYYRIGEFVNAGQPIVSILAPSNVKLIFFVPENYLAKVKDGQQIMFHCDGCTKKMQATVSYISDQAEYTPPVIYSRRSRAKLVYRIEARVKPEVAQTIHVGQPIDIFFNAK